MPDYDPALDGERSYLLCVEKARDGDEHLRAIFEGRCEAISGPLTKDPLEDDATGVALEQCLYWVSLGVWPGQALALIGAETPRYRAARWHDVACALITTIGILRAQKGGRR